MKRVLLFVNRDSLAPVGGQRGYIYNLIQGWKVNEDIELDFLEKKSIRQKYHGLYEYLPSFIKEKHRSRQNLKDCKYLIGNKLKNFSYDFDRFDVIHFHSTFDFYKCKDSLKDYKGKILLTSHSPKPMYLEKIEDGITEADRKKYIKYYKQLEKIDEYAFSHADYVIFPCEEAEEPYVHRWSKFQKIKEIRKDHFKYLPTGVKQCIPKVGKEAIRDRYGIPQNAFVICYVGRHNEVKGYDLLKEAAKEIINEYSNIYFICAGNERPITRLHHERWIEVGWTDDPYSIVNASDIFILPNRETYFDLVLLEVLSLGKPVIASDTGGNKYFHRYQKSGIVLYKDIHEVASCIKKLYKDKTGVLEQMGKNNREIFDKEFNEIIFANRYKELLYQIL